jgi:hypothetical protein
MRKLQDYWDVAESLPEEFRMYWSVIAMELRPAALGATHFFLDPANQLFMARSDYSATSYRGGPSDYRRLEFVFGTHLREIRVKSMHGWSEEYQNEYFEGWKTVPGRTISLHTLPRHWQSLLVEELHISAPEWVHA